MQSKKKPLNLWSFLQLIVLKQIDQGTLEIVGDGHPTFNYESL